MHTQPARIGRYRIIKELDSGGQSCVYVAAFEGGEPQVCYALKVMAGAFDEAARARFHREIQIGMKVQHTNICRMVDWGIEDDVLFLVMELLEGQTLEQYVAQHGPLELEAARAVLQQVLHGLAAIHDCGVVHRDLKPANIFMTHEGVVKILDFGFSRAGAAASAHRDLTPSGMFIGTIDFVAPEQLISARSVDARADIFNVGLLGYYLLTGKLPFASADFGEHLHRLTRGIRTPLAEHRPDLPPAVETWLDAVLAVDREQRPANTREALRQLAF